MKTSPAARRIIKVRFCTICLAIAGLATIELWLGESFAFRVGQTSGSQIEVPQAPPLGFDGLLSGPR